MIDVINEGTRLRPARFLWQGEGFIVGVAKISDSWVTFICDAYDGRGGIIRGEAMKNMILRGEDWKKQLSRQDVQAYSVPAHRVLEIEWL